MTVKLVWPASVIVKGSIVTALLLASALTLVVADTVTKQRDFEGSIDIALCGKLPDGKWTTFDHLKIPSARISATLKDLASRKEVTSGFSFSGRTEKGLTATARMSGPGNGSANLNTGEVSLSIPFECTLNGKRFNLALSLTTGTAKSPDGGTISGRSATIDLASRTATLAMVGNASFKTSDLSEAIQLLKVDSKKQSDAKKEADAKKESDAKKGSDAKSTILHPEMAKADTPTELLLVFQSEGKVTAK